METVLNQSITPQAEPYYDCIVISDLHLGSDVCQARLLEEFLTWAVERCHELVINGDIFDDLNFKRLTKRHFACLKIIRRNSDRDDFRLVWVRGNHDGPADIISHIVGVEILDEYVFDNQQVRLLILHGDQFDTFTTGYPWFTEIACGIFLLYPEVHAPPGIAMGSTDLEALAAQQSARRAPGHRVRPEPWLPIRDLRPHPSPSGHQTRWRRLYQQRHLDRRSPLPIRDGPGERSPTRRLADGTECHGAGNRERAGGAASVRDASAAAGHGVYGHWSNVR